MPHECDVVVIGSGLAGLAAARTCLERGRRVTVLEARDRVGGRTWTRPFRGTMVDLGAEWVSPDQHTAVMAELRRYGIDLATAPTAELVTWSFQDRAAVGPRILTDSEEAELSDLFAHLESDAGRIDFADPRWHEAVADLDVPLASYLDTFDLSPVTRGFFLLHAFALMGADETRYSVLHLLHEFAGFGTCQEAFEGESERIGGGAMSIASAFARDVEPSLSFGTVVRTVQQRDDGVRVLTDTGELTASAAIVAVPVNVLRTVELDVPLPEAARRVIAEGHDGAITKVWTAAVGLPTPYLSAGWPDVPESYGVEADGGLAVATFQLVREADSGRATATALATLRTRHPDATFGDDHLTHDWVGDPWARGTWQTAAAGQAAGWYELAAHPGPCFFAGGDLSRRWVGWMDGALTSGADAAARALALLEGRPVPPVRG